jgi:predicted nucleic acid-binding protein
LDFNIKKAINPNQYPDFKKDYRPSQDFLNTIKVVQATIRQQIIKITKNIDDGFSNYNMTDIINNIYKVDFNDLCIEEVASISKFKIVTDDKDFKITSKEVEILTSNPKLLNP